RAYRLPTARKHAGVDAAGLDTPGHPLLGALVESATDDTVIVSGRLSRNTPSWLAEHAVHDEVLLPGTAFVEMIWCAANLAGCGRIDELVLATPLLLPDRAAVQVQITVGPPEADGVRPVTVHSRVEDTAEWTRHAEGTVSPDAEEPDRRMADLAGVWPPPDAEPVDLSGFYPGFATRGYGHGPAFRGLRAAWRRGGQVFAEVALPIADAAGYGLHPALFDAACHALVLTGHDENAVQAGLPFAWSGATLHSAGATMVRVGVTAVGPATVALAMADQSGTPVATVAELVVRPVGPGRLRTDGRSMYRVHWRPLDLGTANRSPSVVRVGQDEELGDLTRIPDVVLATVGDEPSGGPLAGARTASGHALRLVHQWLADDRFASARLVIATRGAVRTGPQDAMADVAVAPVWGLVRSAQTEHPGRFLLVDAAADDLCPATLAALLEQDEPQAAVRGDTVYVPRLVRAGITDPKPLDLSGTVLVTGAGGTLGRLVARHLVENHGVRDLVLAGRRAETLEAVAADLGVLGASARVAVCDVADPDQAAALVGSVTGRLAAVVHLAGVLDDGVVQSMTPSRLDEVLRPKADAAFHLDQLTRDRRPDAFVLFSSAAGIFGSAGQANYAAANAFLDALAEQRRSEGLPATSLAWALWAERSGMTRHLNDTDMSRMTQGGMVPLDTATALALFDAGLEADDPVLVPVALNLSRRRREGTAVPSLLRDLSRSANRRPRQLATSTPDQGAPSKDTLIDRLAALRPAERERAVVDLVRTQVAAVLGHESVADIASTRLFKDLGFESLTAIELRNRLSASTGLRLPATLVYDHPTSAALAAFLDGRLIPTADPAPEVPGEPEAASRSTPAAAIDTLGVDDLVRLALDASDS
ncbi:type I polyketide synthase, partial [Micromonospora wenchangensis]|uniref:type I polyketide synthase n=1 Tax=Micromonospora wenchangensis TaxID=1185415 RepID=UPI003D70DFBD